MAEAATGKEPGSDPLADLGEPLVEAGGDWNSPWDIDAAISGRSTHQEGAGAGKHHFRVFPVAY